MTSAFSWQNSIRLCPASFRIPRPNLPVTTGVSWLPTLHSSPLRLAKFLNLRSYLGRILHVAVFFKVWKLLSLLDSSDFRGAAYFNHLLLRLEPQYNMLSIV